jgi:hypothetical protein
MSPAMTTEEYAPLEPNQKPPPRAWPDIISAAELCANPPATPEVLIEGILYRGGTELFAGPSKAHKTYSMLDQALAIAEGSPWLGFKTTQTPGIYVNLELQSFAVAQRLNQITSARGGKPPKELYFLNLRGHRVTDDKLISQLPTMMKDRGAGILWIDPHYKIQSVQSREENSNTDQGRLLSDLESICLEGKSALGLAHHFAKGDASSKSAIDRPAGAGAFGRWPDAVITITPHKEPDAMVFEMSLRLFAPIEPFVARWVHPRWVRDGKLNAADLQSKAGAKEKYPSDKVLAALGDKLLGYGEWSKLTGLSDTTFRRKRDALIEAGKVEQIGNQYRAVNPP